MRLRPRGSGPLTVSFTDLSTGDPDTWSWEFGDDGKSTQQNPTHTYTKPGEFKVLLVASNGCGSNEVVKEKYILVPEGAEGQGMAMGDVLPQSFELKQNYPNPFNPSTEISFTLSASAYVTLEIYNITGQKVEELINRQMGSGQHTVYWNASNQPSGVYLYRLAAGSLVDIKKMVLLK